MAENKTFFMEWPALGIKVECGPIEINRHAYDWFLENLPLSGLQGHAAVSGWLMYIMNLKLSKYPEFRYEDLEIEDLSKEVFGRVNIFITAGRVGSIMVKYGEITEDMCYPTIAQVLPGDIEKLKEAGYAVWNAMYKTKDIITVNFTLK